MEQRAGNGIQINWSYHWENREMASRVSAKRSAQRRLREFLAVRNRVRRNKESFIRRLQGLVRSAPNGCVRFLGHHTPDGYGKMNFKLAGKHIQIGVQRVFLILKLGRQIKLKHDAGHEDDCPFRDCVLHVFEQPTELNSAATGGGWAREREEEEDIPF